MILNASQKVFFVSSHHHNFFNSMATPKKPVPIKQRKSRTDIEKAVKTAASMETPGVTQEEGSAKKTPPLSLKSTLPPEPKPNKPKKIGRPPLVEGRNERITVFLTTKNKKRFKRALLQEQLRRDETGDPIDQSLLVEEVLEAWMDANSY